MKFLKKIKKKPLFLSLGAIVIVAAVYLLVQTNSSNAADGTAQTEILEKGLLSNTLYVSGTVQSDNTRKVYSTEGLDVLQVLVEEGDVVGAGDTLAVLDTSTLELEIKQTRLNINNLSNSISTEQDTLNDNVESARIAVNNAEIALVTAERNYNNNLKLFESEAIAKDQLLESETALKNAQSKVEETNLTLASALNKDTSSTQNSLEVDRVSLEKQLAKLDKAVITAPIAGTVTMVNAEVGEVANGLMFVVEETQNLVVTAEIGEYDISSVQPGQTVRIKTDSTGKEEFSGTVSLISPTANKTADGSTNTSSNVKFEVKIAFADTQDKVKIGMNARMNIVLEEKEDVFSVNYEAIRDSGGNKSLFVASLQDGKYVLREIPVTTGLENDSRVEIAGPELEQGMLIVTNPDPFQAGSVVKL